MLSFADEKFTHPNTSNGDSFVYLPTCKPKKLPSLVGIYITQHPWTVRQDQQVIVFLPISPSISADPAAVDMVNIPFFHDGFLKTTGGWLDF